jgi:aldehyde:ferredoxin oxidoreductase
MTLSSVEMRQAHRLLAEMTYARRPVRRGYADRTLHINLSNNAISEQPVPAEIRAKFTGGKGYCLWLLWNAVNDSTRWNDPENALCIAGGPIGGITAYPGSGKCTVVTISPLTGIPIDSNSGGHFGPLLKFAGFDAMQVQGKAERDVIIYIDGDSGRVTVEEAPLEEVNTHLLIRQLTDMYAAERRDRRSLSIITAGQAADHVAMCGLNVSYYDIKRDEIRIKQAARGGSGRVFRDKRIKAIVVRYSALAADSNGVADMALIRKAGQRINKEISDFDASQNDMRHTGTPYLIEIMDKFDLLPVQNFRFGADPNSGRIAGEIWKSQFDLSGPDGCWLGCTVACAHGVKHYHLRTGAYAGQVVFVDGPEYETLGGLGSNLSIWDPADLLELNFYCDTYGIDTISAGNSIAFAMECYEAGILNLERTGGLALTWGNADAALALIHQMAAGEGFGMIVGQGVKSMRHYFARHFGADPRFLRDRGMEIKGLEVSEYMTKESLAQQGGYALASKGPQHDEAWLIFMDMVHKQLPSFEARAEALHYFPVWRTWFSLHGLCKLPWNDIIPGINKTAKEPAKVPEHVENYTWLYEGVTGIKVTPEDLMLQSERVYNFQRAFNLRMGAGKRVDDYPPYRAVGPVTGVEYESRAERYDKSLREEVGIEPGGMTTAEKVAALRKYREDRYEQLVDAVYKRRGWTAEGVPTVETLRRLGMDFPDLIALVKAHGG